MIRAHKNLDVWKESVELVTLIYKTTGTFPATENYGLSAQMRRAGVSIPSNIAEGAARYSKKEFTQFLHIAGGSLSELDTQVEIACRLGYITETMRHDITVKMDGIAAKLAGLVKSVKKKVDNPLKVNGEK
jgi:four helix bundle protein